MLSALLRPISPPEDEDRAVFRRDPEARIPGWDLGRTMARLLPTIQGLGEPALAALVALLDQALAMIHRDGTDKWEDYEDHDDTLRAHLVSVIRDSAIRIIESNPSRLPKIIALYKKQRWVFFRRLALSLLQRFYAAAPDLAVAWTLDRSYLDLTGPEYARLLRVSFKSLSQGQQETILAWIDGGPQFPESSDAYANTWRMRRLRVIEESLPEDWRQRYEALKAKYGDVPAADTEPPSHQPFIGPTSPFRDEELAQMTPTQVVDTVGSWKPSSEFDSPEPEGLSRTLESVVGQQPESYAAAAEDLKRLEPVYLPGAFRGFAVAARAGRAFDWKPVVDLCAWATSHPRKISQQRDTSFR